MSTPEITNFLELPTHTLMEQFGAGLHKPGSGSAAALFGLVACKMMQTVVTVTLRNPKYAANTVQLNFVSSDLTKRHVPFFHEAVQRDAAQFDRYHKARLARNACTDEVEKRRLRDAAREHLMPATEIPLEIADHAITVAEKGLVVYDLGVTYARGDSGAAISAALSSCSGALFIVYLNLLDFREGAWATKIRSDADLIKARWQSLLTEQFQRVSRIQAEGVDTPQLQLGLPFLTSDDEDLH